MSSDPIPDNGDSADTDLVSIALVNKLLTNLVLDVSDWMDDILNVNHESQK